MEELEFRSIAQCDACQQGLSFENTTKLRNHLLKHHQEVFNELQAIENGKDVKKEEELFQVVVDYIQASNTPFSENWPHSAPIFLSMPLRVKIEIQLRPQEKIYSERCNISLQLLFSGPLSDEDWCTLVILKMVFQKMAKIQEKLEGQNYVTISMIPKEVTEIHKVINSANDGSILQEKPNVKEKYGSVLKEIGEAKQKKSLLRD